MANMRTRDSDIAVTGHLPVLVEAFPYEKRDGRIILANSEQIPVRILPHWAVEGIFDSERREEINREYNAAFRTVKDNDLAELQALAFLLRAVRERSKTLLHRYIKQQAPVEARRLRENIQQVLARLEAASKKAGGEENSIDLAQAARSLVLRTRYPLSELSSRLNARLRRARFVLWWSDARGVFIPGLWCEEMSTALVALLSARADSPQSIAVCERCAKDFPTKKRSQRYCSLRCGNAARKARERAKNLGRAKR